MKGQRSAVPSEFTDFLSEAPAPPVICRLLCTLCHLQRVLFSEEEPRPTFMLFFSPGYVCLTDAYKMVTSIFPVIEL